MLKPAREGIVHLDPQSPSSLIARYASNQVYRIFASGFLLWLSLFFEFDLSRKLKVSVVGASIARPRISKQS